MSRSKSKIAIVATAVAVLTVAGTALAGKPTSTLNLVVLSSGDTRTAAAEPAWGGQVTFEVSSAADRPFVNVRCYQGGAFVYDGWHGFFESYVPEPTFTLASTYWTSGEADCTARLLEWGRNGRERELMTLDFHVSA